MPPKIDSAFFVLSRAKSAMVRKIEEVGRGDLTDHDRLGDAAAGEELNHLVELADSEPFDLVHQAFDHRIRLIGECGGDEALHSGGAGGAGERGGVDAISGDHSHGLENFSHDMLLCQPVDVPHPMVLAPRRKWEGGKCQRPGWAHFEMGGRWNFSPDPARGSHPDPNPPCPGRTPC